MRHISGAIQSLVLAAAIPLLFNIHCIAQSFPAGQVTHRAQAKAGVLPSKAAQNANNGQQFADLMTNPVATCPSDKTAFAQCKAKNGGEAASAAWAAVAAMDPSNSLFSTNEVNAAWSVATAVGSITDANNLTQAQSAAERAFETSKTTYKDDVKAQQAAEMVVKAVKSLRCSYNSQDQSDSTGYSYPTLFPTLGKGCLTPLILNYFSVEQKAAAGNGVQYLYNAQESTSQVNADLITATFPIGFQAVLAGTATAGSSQTTPASSSGTTTTSQTDSVSTTVAKIENGGDFNIRFPFPILSHFGQKYMFDGRLVPNVGFDINKFGAQSTITESSDYAINVPFEFYAQTTSLDAQPTIGFIDLKPSAEVISSQLAQSIGLTGSRGFFLGEAAIGLEFAQKIRISAQYFAGPHQIYQTMSSTGTTTTTSTHIGGFHLAVSFSPQKGSSTSN